MYKIFFNTIKILLSCKKNLNNIRCRTSLDIITLSKKMKIYLENWKNLNNQTICIICNNHKIENCFKDFSSFFLKIEAAGGLVLNSQNQVLIIKRNNIWDLPKGKKEKAEDYKTTAIREVSEETGLKRIIVENLFDYSFHIYDTYGKWTLKTTHWYIMRTNDNNFTPQKEEGIEEVVFISHSDLHKYKKNMYPLVYELIKKYYTSEK